MNQQIQNNDQQSDECQEEKQIIDDKTLKNEEETNTQIQTENFVSDQIQNSNNLEIQQSNNNPELIDEQFNSEAQTNDTISNSNQNRNVCLNQEPQNHLSQNQQQQLFPQQQHQQQQVQNDVIGFNENIDHLAFIISSIDNQLLLQRAPLENLVTLLQIASPGEFDDINDPQSLSQLIEQQYQKKKSDLEAVVYQVMKGYDELNLKVNLSQLEKIMRILKSKVKSIYITKDQPIGHQCFCQHHQPEQNEQENQSNDNQQENFNEDIQINQNNNENQEIEINEEKIIDQQSQQQIEQNIIEEQNQQLNDKQQKNDEEQYLVNEQTYQTEVQIENLIEKQEKELEELKESQETSQQIDISQKEIEQIQEQRNPDTQVQENQNEEIQMTQEEIEKSVEMLKDSIQKSREQIEKLTEQRDALIQRSKELAEKQQDLKIQQQNILKQLGHQEEEENKSISCTDIFGIMSLHNLNLTQLQHYNDQRNSLIFKLNKNYTVEIKSDDLDQNRNLNNDSYLKQIPGVIFQRQILPYLSALELFKAREVCGWFKEQVKQTWPVVFKREMFEQLLQKDLIKNIYALQKLQILKHTLFIKISSLIEAIIQVIDWNHLNDIILSKNIEIFIYRPLIGLLSLFNKQQQIQYAYQIDGTFDISELALEMKQQVKDYINAEFLPKSFNEMRKLNNNILAAPEFGLDFVSGLEDKLPLYLTILVQQLYFQGLIHQTFVYENSSLKKWKQEQEMLEKRQSYNQNFLEGAYKKLLLKSYQDDQDDETTDMEADPNEAAQFLRALTNLVPSENPEPDIVIRRNKTVTRIYIDINTKLDILVQTIESYKITKQDQNPQDQQQQLQLNQINEEINVEKEDDTNENANSKEDQKENEESFKQDRE